jgi:hypothetical protein
MGADAPISSARYTHVIGVIEVARGTMVAPRITINMRNLVLLLGLVGCTTGTDPQGGGDDTPGPDASMNPNTDGSTQGTCPMAAATPETGALTASKTQRCNVPNTMGARKWYRMMVTLPGAPNDIVQLELWDGQGAFTGGVVRTGTFTISGAETSYQTCGVCLRAVGDKGTAGQKLYLATGGTVEITSVGVGGTTLAAKITNAAFAEVDANNAKVTGGCTSSLAGSTLSGTIVDTGGGGDGGGGGGGSACPLTIGD